MNFLQIAEPIPKLYPDVVFHIGNFPITNSIMSTWLSVFLIIVFVFFLKKRIQLRPESKVQMFFEIIMEGIIGLLDQITNSRKRSEKLFSLVGSIFLFFLLLNTITLIPGLSAIELNGVTIFRTATTDFNTTLSLAVLVVFVSQMASIRSKGFFPHIGQYIQIKKLFLEFKKGIKHGLLAMIDFAMGFLDIVGELARIISLSLRLFGNIFAGEVLMVVMMSFLSIGAPSILLAQSLLVGGLQAVVFSVLSAVYLNLALGPEENVLE